MTQLTRAHEGKSVMIQGLSTEDREFFKREGYLVVKHVFDASLVSSIRREITKIVAQNPGVEELVQIEPCVTRGELIPANRELGVRKLFRMAKYNDFFRELTFHPGMLNIVGDLLGSDLKLVQSMLLMKPPYVREPKVWHQDNAYFRLRPNKVMGWWIALDSTDESNGCMHIIPGSHCAGIDSHEGTGDHYGLSKQPSFREALAVPLRSGDGLIFHGELHHGTPPNVTKTRRRALQYHYASALCKSESKPEREPEVIFRRCETKNSI